MGLQQDEIFEGVVAYLDPAVLNAHPDVVAPPSPAPRPGPFLCIEADAQRSCWIELTSRPGRDRIEIPASARKGGSPRWRFSAVYVNDPRSTYVGAHAAFVAAARGDHWESSLERPCVDLQSVVGILRAVVAAKARRLGGTLALPDRRPVRTDQGQADRIRREARA